MLCPDLVDKAVGGQFVFIAAVNHQLVLVVEHRDCAGGLSVGEVKDVIGGSGQCGYHDGQGQKYLFHD